MKWNWEAEGNWGEGLGREDGVKLRSGFRKRKIKKKEGREKTKEEGRKE